MPPVGIGQEVAVTALQLVGAYSAIANGGYLMEPKIIKSLLAHDELAGRARVVLRRIRRRSSIRDLLDVIFRFRSVPQVAAAALRTLARFVAK